MTAGLKAGRYRPEAEKARVIRELKKLARPARDFDARRYFRGDLDLAFYNVATGPTRALARSIVEEHDAWTVDDAMALADVLVCDRYLEVKSVGIELVARYRHEFTPRLLPHWKRWLAENHSSNWATTDGISVYLIGALVVRYPELACRIATWARHRNLWVRRASIVGLIPAIRKNHALDVAYGVAARLHGDDEDLIQKAVGWALRECGRVDSVRLECYLRANGRAIPRTTLRYAIERFAEPKRQSLLKVTRGL